MSPSSLQSCSNTASEPVAWIVDDSASVRASTRLLLETLGVTVRDYASPMEFLDEIDSAARGCLIVDFHMPEMSGLEVLETLRSRGSVLPAIVITGRGDPELAAQVTRAGALTMLHKPIDSSELLAVVEPLMLNRG